MDRRSRSTEDFTEAMAWSDSEEIYARLDRLGEYRTISAFGLAYYEAIADYLSGEGRSAQGLRLRFAEFLEVMERYHRALEVFTVEDQVTMGNVRSAAERRDIGLEALLEQLAVDETRGDAEIGRLLLSAECYYQLALVERVVAKLEAAVEAGAVHPLAQFALGYNRFDLAMRAFTRYDGDAGERVVDDEDRFRLACLSAVAAMQDGLSGSSFDCELHWWIGHILQAAGFDETARASFDKAEELAHAMGLQQETEDAALALGLEIESDYEYDPISESGPISEDEVRQAGQLLRLSYTQSEIMDD